MSKSLPIAALASLFVFAGPRLTAQDSKLRVDPEVRKLLDDIRRDMRTIDKLLERASANASSARRSKRTAAEKDAGRPLDASVRTSRKVVETIDKLLEHIAKSRGS